MSGRTYLSIGDVLALLRQEFPDVTISKIRFLESQGLVDPERTPSGYRKFYEADIERLRWILRQQRENFLPLKVIKGRLDQAGNFVAELPREPSLFDAEPPSHEESAAELPATANGRHGGRGSDEPPGPPEDPSEPLAGQMAESPEPVVEAAVEPDPEPDPTTSLAADPESLSDPAVPMGHVASPAGLAPGRSELSGGVSLSLGELVGATGASAELVAGLVDFGLVEAKVVAGVVCYDERALEVTRIATGFASYGIEPRHLRSLKHAAERQAGLYAQVVTPLLRQRSLEAREKARSDLVAMSELGAGFVTIFLEAALEELAGG